MYKIKKAPHLTALQKNKDIHHNLLTYSVFFLLFLSSSLYASYFDSPPANWQCVEDSSQLPKKVHVLYVGKGSTRFAPTIHLASEVIVQNFDEYMAAAKHYHERAPSATCHDLGKMSTKSGVARLLHIKSPSVYGTMSLLQAYILYEGEAYVVTGTALQEDFKEFSPIFYATVASFHLTPPLTKP